jgi:mannan endo-1,4-beta-mannosidase
VEYYYSRNGIISFCWHMMDPTGTGFYLKDLPDKSAGNELLPGGKQHQWFLGQLDRIAFFFQQLKGPGGESIPILFRPFHEMDGDWFWWGKPNVSAETFSHLWQFTYHYLVDEKQLNQLLFVFSPCDRFKTRDGEMGYLAYYPGDAWVDILAQDNYWQVRTGADSVAFVNQLRIMTRLAAEKNKISGISETGLAGLTNPDWFTSVLLKPVKNDSLARRITYISLWNRSFVPFSGHPAVPDFLAFYHDPVTLFIGDYPDLYHSLIVL